MRKKHKVLIKLFLLLSTIPLLIFAYEFGPPPGVTGAPGDNKTGCIESGCHTGTPNSGTGSVKISLPGGVTTYSPGGPAIPITILITDTKMKSYGFELTARSGTAGTTQAGDFNPADANTQAICADGSAKATNKACPAPFTIEDIEHTLTGWSNSISTKGSFTYTVNWTPPATAVGNVTMYIAANCGTGGPAVTPTDVYLANVVLTPAASNPNAPAITANGVVPVYSTMTTIQPSSWISIYGTNLATSMAVWTGDFPTTLGGASVTINGKSGFLYYASPTQINLQAPSDTATGSVNVVVMNSNGTATSTVTLGQFGPSFSRLDATHVAGIILRPDGSGSNGTGASSYDIVGPTGTSLGYKTVAAKAGDSLVLFGVGFGPTTPPVTAGQAYSGAAATNNTVSLLINSQSETPAFAGLTSAGLYQFNLTVPAGLGTGDVPLQATVGGVTTPSGVVLSLQ